MLESGSVSAKDEVNIMVKNVVDVVFGGLSYWSVGYGLSYGDYEPFRNSFIGFGRFFYDPTRSVTANLMINLLYRSPYHIKIQKIGYTFAQLFINFRNLFC